MAEEAKVAVRNVRRDALDKFKTQKKNSEITEDDLKNLEDKMQKITDKYVKNIDVYKRQDMTSLLLWQPQWVC